jgi:hypothetical protein
MRLTGIPASYLWSEMQKSAAPISFCHLLLNETTNHPELKLPFGQEFSEQLSELKKVIVDPSKHEAWMIGLEWVGFDCSLWQQFFSLSADSAKRSSSWAKISRHFQTIHPEVFQGEFEQVIKMPDFDLLFNWYFTTRHLMQRSPDVPFLSLVEKLLPEWVHLYRFEPLRDVKHIDPPLRAKYQVWNLCQRL